MKQYKKKDGTTIFALPLALPGAQLAYSKWGGEQSAKEDDWLVLANQGDKQDCYTVDRDSFRQTYTALGEHLYHKSQPVWAEAAESDGSISTKEGSTRYNAGDMLVYNNPDKTDGYAVAHNEFWENYQLLDDSAANEASSPKDKITREKNMRAKDYLEQRLDDQIQWYEKKSAYNQKRFKQCQLWAIILSAAIPLLTAVSFAELEENLLRFTVALLGSLVAVLNAVLALYKFQENWVQYRNAAESLLREKFLFLTGASPYDDEIDRFTLLVGRCEGIMFTEQVKWYRQATSKPELTANKPAEKAG